MKKIIVSPNIQIKKALKIMTKQGEKCLVISDKKKKLLGTISDGDIRKALLNGKDINESIFNIFNKKAIFFYENNFDEKKIKKIFINKKIDIIPIVDQSQKIIKILDLKKILSINIVKRNKKCNVPVLIMAGGKGDRMQPFTKVLPKALIPINGIPIIEKIVDKFRKNYVNNFYISINYKFEIIKAFFKEIKKNYKIHFIEEKKPLGTAGSIKLISSKIKDNLIVTNCDILCDIDFYDFLEFHKKNNFDLSCIASTKEYEIPYGTCILNNAGSLDYINEKPKISFLVNTGIYILNKKIFKYIPKNTYFDMTELIQKIKKNKGKVGVFPISEHSWIDIGQWDEYNKIKDKFL